MKNYGCKSLNIFITLEINKYIVWKCMEMYLYCIGMYTRVGKIRCAAVRMEKDMQVMIITISLIMMMMMMVRQ
jgi:hypothetical protein